MAIATGKHFEPGQLHLLSGRTWKKIRKYIYVYGRNMGKIKEKPTLAM